MNSTLEYIRDKYNLDLEQRRMPIIIPNTGRGNLGGLFKELGFVVGAEIGVLKGSYAKTLCRTHPELKLYGVDGWQVYSGYKEHLSQDKMDQFFEIAKKRMRNFNWVPIRKFSLEAAKDFKPKSLDFVYLDGNHTFAHVVNDIDCWLTKVKKGGIIAGHDFRRRRRGSFQVHVVEAVHGYTQAHCICPWFVLGRKEKVEGEIRDASRSWMWVRM